MVKFKPGITLLLLVIAIIGFGANPAYSQDNLDALLNDTQPLLNDTQLLLNDTQPLLNDTQLLLNDVSKLDSNADGHPNGQQNTSVFVLDDIYFDEFDINFRISIAQFDNILALFRRNFIQVPSGKWRSEWNNIKTIEYLLLNDNPSLTYAHIEYLNVTALLTEDIDAVPENENSIAIHDRVAFSILYDALLNKRKALKADIDSSVSKFSQQNPEFQQNYKSLIIQLKQIRSIQELFLQQPSSLALLIGHIPFETLTQLNTLQAEYRTALDEVSDLPAISQRKIWILHHQFSAWSEYLSEIMQNDPKLLEHLLRQAKK